MDKDKTPVEELQELFKREKRALIKKLKDRSISIETADALLSLFNTQIYLINAAFIQVAEEGFEAGELSLWSEMGFEDFTDYKPTIKKIK